MAIARFVMHSEIISARPDERVTEVAQRMRQHEIGAVLIVDAGKLVGIFSERDLLTRVVAEGRDPATTAVGDVATHAPVTVDADTSVRRCAEILKEMRCRHLPVVDGGRPIGIIAARDFFEYVASGLERFIDQRRYETQLEKGVDPYEGLGGSYQNERS
jgi:CBS domain-containing protein